jgi:hypothetical protein
MTAAHAEAIKRWHPGQRLGFRYQLWALQIRGELTEKTERAAFEDWQDAPLTLSSPPPRP